MIRWIDTSIGTAAFGDDEARSRAVLDVRVLVDGPANTPDALRGVIEAGLGLLISSGNVVVCCDRGISRSNTIAAAIVARRDGMSFDDSLRLVQERTGEQRMDFGLVNSVRRVLEPTDPRRPVPSRVLVTGGTGFLGSWVRASASGEAEVIAPPSAELDLEAGPFGLDRVVRAARPSVIMHLANPRNPQVIDAVPRTVAMMQSVLEVCREHGAFLAFASGWIVLNGHARAEPLVAHDDEPCRPHGHYAVAKALSEQMIDHASADGRVRASILRLSPIYGAGSPQPRLLFRIAESLRAGEPAVTHVYRNGRPRLQLLHAQDAAAGLLAAARARIPGRFNMGGAVSATTCEIAQEIARAIRVPFRGSEMSLEADVAQVTLECSKSDRLLGWRPRVSLESGVAALLRGDPAHP
jgi:nucleoside-diphosphate-sugar epimerase